jgi:hypothetical protein
MANSNSKALIRRYVVWAYKSTKESFDRLERKTTQLMVDEYILAAFKKFPSKSKDEEYAAQVEEFKQYVAKKREQPVPPGKYLYLQQRLSAVEGAIKHFLGAAELKKIQAAYEEEFTRRIWESKDH